jgi:hypothetical protein
MTPVRSSKLNASSDLHCANQTSNGVYPVNRPAVDTYFIQSSTGYLLTGRLMG